MLIMSLSKSGSWMKVKEVLKWFWKEVNRTHTCVQLHKIMCNHAKRSKNKAHKSLRPAPPLKKSGKYNFSEKVFLNFAGLDLGFYLS